MLCRPMKNTISGNEAKGFMKIIVDADSDTVIGVHMIGPECAEILQVGCFDQGLWRCIESSKLIWSIGKDLPRWQSRLQVPLSFSANCFFRAITSDKQRGYLTASEWACQCDNLEPEVTVMQKQPADEAKELAVESRAWLESGISNLLVVFFPPEVQKLTRWK